MAARLAQRRLGVFSGTRRSLLEQGPTRGYGYDETAGDFLDNAELRKVLLQVKAILGRKLDILWFDACLMAMIEVAYQVHDLAHLFVASERTEPGDGWWYSRAFENLTTLPTTSAAGLAKDIVTAYRDAYQDEMTLSAVDLEQVPLLVENLDAWVKAVAPEDSHRLRRSALDCSPRPGDRYCDLGSFLEAAVEKKNAPQGHAEAGPDEKAVESGCRGLLRSQQRPHHLRTGNFRPQQAGSTDALYLGLNFVRETEWGNFLRKVYPRLEKPVRTVEQLPIPSPVSALDRNSARHVLAAALSQANESWVDLMRSKMLAP